ncbi:hypothetical protein D1872_226080 [compost metagenome]
MVHREGFMTRAEIEDLAQPSLIAAAAAENFAALEPGDEHQLIRGRDFKAFAVHFFLWNFNILAQSPRDRMARLNDPDPLFFPVIPPFQRSGVRSHQAAENLGGMPRVKHNQSHAVQHLLPDPLDDRIADFVMRHMAPPEQHVRLLQHLVRQPMLRLIQHRGSNFQIPETL